MPYVPRTPALLPLSTMAAERSKRPRPVYDDDDDDNDEKTPAKQSAADHYKSFAENEVVPAVRDLEEKARRLRQIQRVRNDDFESDHYRHVAVREIKNLANVLTTARQVLSGETEPGADLAAWAKQVDVWKLRGTVLYHSNVAPVSTPAAMRWLFLGTECTPDTPLRRMAQNPLYESKLLPEIAAMTQAHRTILPDVHVLQMHFEPYTQRLVIVEVVTPANTTAAVERLLSCDVDGRNVKRSEALKNKGSIRLSVSRGKAHICELETLEIAHYSLPTLEKIATTKMLPLLDDAKPIYYFAIDSTGTRMYFAGQRVMEVDVATCEVVDVFDNPIGSHGFRAVCGLHHLYFIGPEAWSVQRAKPHRAQQKERIITAHSDGETDVFYTRAVLGGAWTAVHEDKDGQNVRQAYQVLNLPRDSPEETVVLNMAASQTHVFAFVVTRDIRETRVYPNLMI